MTRCPVCKPLTPTESRHLGDKAYRLPWKPCPRHEPPSPPGRADAVMDDPGADPGEVARAQQAIRDHASALDVRGPMDRTQAVTRAVLIVHSRTHVYNSQLIETYL